MILASPKAPHVAFIDGKWQTMARVVVRWKDFKFEIPKGYRCDLGSVPWVAQWIVKSTGRGNLGFLCHDFVYDDDTELPKDRDGVEMTREQGDEMMRDLLRYSGLAKWRAFVAWRGVRRGGWYSFKKED